MTSLSDLPYRQVWAVDFEFTAPVGEQPYPLCCVARELKSRRLVRCWLDPDHPALPPYDLSPDALFVAFLASAELGCHLALDWSFPARVLDLYVEKASMLGPQTTELVLLERGRRDDHGCGPEAEGDHRGRRHPPA
jgi:hypothetical protein